MGAKTSFSQKLSAGLEGKIHVKSPTCRIYRVKEKGRFPNTVIGNRNETPVYYIHVPGKAVDRMGMKSCIVQSMRAEKRHITVVLTNGSTLPSTCKIIFKRVSFEKKSTRRGPHTYVCKPRHEELLEVP